MKMDCFSIPGFSSPSAAGAHSNCATYRCSSFHVLPRSCVRYTSRLHSTRSAFLHPSVRCEASIHSDSVGCILTSLITNDGSSGTYLRPRSTVIQCCRPEPRKKILLESEGATWNERMPERSSSTFFSILAFCRSHERPSSPERYTKFFWLRTKTDFLSSPTH